TAIPWRPTSCIAASARSCAIPLIACGKVYCVTDDTLSSAGFAGAPEAGGRQEGARREARDDRRKGGDAPLPSMRAGFVALTARPNASKSTLLNRLVGETLSI